MPKILTPPSFVIVYMMTYCRCLWCLLILYLVANCQMSSGPHGPIFFCNNSNRAPQSKAVWWWRCFPKIADFCKDRSWPWIWWRHSMESIWCPWISHLQSTGPQVGCAMACESPETNEFPIHDYSLKKSTLILLFGISLRDMNATVIVFRTDLFLCLCWNRPYLAFCTFDERTFIS